MPEAVATAEWADVAAVLAGAGWAASLALRQAGTQGVMQAFFDEMFSHLDPYSRYVAPPAASADEERRDGEAGVGLVLAARGTALVVAQAISGGPAAQAGIRAGDRILSVDGDNARGSSPEDAEDWLDGPEGSEVTLVVQGARGRRRLTLTRAPVTAETVFSTGVQTALVVRLASFTASTATRLATVLEAGLARAGPATGVVLDLRGNRGRPGASGGDGGRRAAAGRAGRPDAGP